MTITSTPASDRPRLGAIVLAAGRGERMGGPKGLLLLHGRPLVSLHVARFLEAGCDEVVVVGRDEVAELVGDADERVRVVVSRQPEPRGSLALGVRAIDRATRLFVTPVDALPASLVTLAALAAALDLAEAATPTFQGRGGHPVACRQEVLKPYRDEPLDQVPTLRDCLHALGSRRVRVEAQDDVAIDLDEPRDVARLTGGSPDFWKRG